MELNHYSELIINQTKDLIWTVDANFMLVYANKSSIDLIQKLFGFDKIINESVVGGNYGKEHEEKWKNFYSRALQGEYFEIEEHFYNPEADCIQFNQITFTPLFSETNEILAVSCHSRDISRIVKEKSESNQLMDASLDVFCTVNQAGKFVFVSAAAQKHWGYNFEELKEKSFSELVLEEDLLMSIESFESIIKGNDIKDLINRYIRKDGSIAYNLWSAHYDPSSGLVYCVAKDIKEKLDQEERIMNNKLRFKALVQEGSDMIAILDSQGEYTYVSPTSTSVLGIRPEEFIGRKAFEFIHPDDMETALFQMQKIFTQNRVLIEPYRFQNKNKEWRWMDTILTNMLDNPSVNGIVANSRDITEKIEERHKLKLFEKVIDSTSDAIIISNAEPLNAPGPSIIFVNKAFTKMTGYTPEEVIGKNPRMFQGPDSNQEELRKLGDKLKRWEPTEATVYNYKKSGKGFWVNLAVSPVADHKGWFTHWISIQRDVTEQKNLEFEKNLLSEISLSFSAEEELITAANRLCENLYQFGKFDLIELWCPNMEQTELKLVGFHTTEEDLYQEEGLVRSFEKNIGIQGIVWHEKKQLLWDEQQIEQQFKRKDIVAKLDLKSVLGVPLTFKDEINGVLIIGSKRESGYIDKHSSVITKLEKFIGSEIHRKRLENDLRHLYDTIPDILCIMDFEGNFLKINNAGCDLLACNQEALLLHSFKEFSHPNDVEVFTNALELLKQGTTTTCTIETRFITQNKKTIWLSWNCSADVFDGLIYASAISITAEKRLRELNKQANTLAKIGSWEVNLENSEVFWSRMVHELHETKFDVYKPSLAAGINFYREDFRELVSQSIDNCIATGVGFDFVAVIVTQNRKEKWVRSIGEVEKLNGEPKRIFGSLQDITDTKESELRFQSFANNLPGVAFQYYMYPDGTEALKYVTAGAQNIYGFTAENVMKDPNLIWNQIKLAGNLEAVKKSILDSIQNNSFWTMQWRYLTPNNDLRIHVGYGSPNFLSDGTILFNSLVLDITEDSKNKELLQQATNLAKIGSWELDLGNLTEANMYWSPMTREILEVDENYIPTLTGGIEFYVDEGKKIIENAIIELVSDGKEFDVELLILTPKGNKKWVRSIGKSERINGKAIKVFGSFQDINLSKSIEIKMREILASISDAFYAVDRDWNFTYFNTEAERLLKREESEVIGKNIWEVFPHAKGTLLEDLYKKVVKTNSSNSFEYFFPGDNCWYEVNAYPAAQGGVSVYFKNIDERKQAASQLAKAFKEKNEILESIGDGFFAVNKDWTITYWNKHAETIMKKKREDIIGKNLWEEYPSAIELQSYVKNQHAMATRESVFYEEYYEVVDLWLELSVYPSEGGLSIFFRNITDRKKADIQLLEANERFELVTKATNDAIWDWDIEKDIFLRSDNIKNFLGDNALTQFNESQFWNDQFHPEDIEDLKNSIEQSVKDQESERWEMEYRMLKDDEIIHVIDRAIIVRDENGKAKRMVGAMTNMSKQKKLENKLSQLNDSLKSYAKELERSNEELEQFAFITSHDLQEPLRMISGFMDQLKRKYSDKLDDKAHQYIYFATDGAKRMKQIILDLLLYSRANKPNDEQEEVSLEELLSEFKQLRRKLIAEKSAKINSNNLPLIKTYKAPVTQILHCLLDNALKYSKSNIAPIITIVAVEKETEWEFAIKDNGIGIDEQFFEKIFIIFQRLHNRGQYDGTGIGLSIAKRSVEFLGGKIWLESKVNEGSIFYFTISKN